MLPRVIKKNLSECKLSKVAEPVHSLHIHVRPDRDHYALRSLQKRLIPRGSRVFDVILHALQTQQRLGWSIRCDHREANNFKKNPVIIELR